MKITKSQLKQIVKEELNRTLAENSQEKLEAIVRNYGLAPIAAAQRVLTGLAMEGELVSSEAHEAKEAIDAVFDEIAGTIDMQGFQLYNVALLLGKPK